MSNIQIVSVAEVPSVKRVRRAESKYPFDKLELGEGNAFFIPATEENPEPWKSIQSSLCNANKRYSVSTGETRINKSGNVVPVTVPTRKFVARTVETPTPGVLVIRVQ